MENSKNTNKVSMKEMSVFGLVVKIIKLTGNIEDVCIKANAKPYVVELGKRLNLNPMQALILSVFVDQCDDSRIRPRDLARHFNCNTVTILEKSKDIDGLVNMGVIGRRKDSDGEITYFVPNRTIEALKEDKLPEKEKMDNLKVDDWIDMMDEMLRRRSNDEVNDMDLSAIFSEMIEKNQHLHFVQQLKALNLSYTDLLLFLVMLKCFINNHDDHIGRGDIHDYFSCRQTRSHARELESGEHTLMEKKLVEHSCVDGQIDSTSWCLTNYSKYDIFAELNLRQPTNVRSNLTRYEDIKEKKLYYTPKVEKQVEQLHSLMEAEKMTRVLERLETKGLRKGFTCIFHGGPGTGKTESVLQLARATKRDIMMVDIPSIRSKWVGEQEKNMKEIFTRYRRAVEGARNGVCPILFFNEADALLNKRNTNDLSCAGKEENSMQNIILQEMENLEGIMICTTNLASSLDSAFERRFLFKISFDKPTAKERQHIWKAMLPDLTDKDAYMLADRFDFSGGQIENITRKRVIDDILNERDKLDIDSIVESCKVEFLNKSNQQHHIGF